MGGCTTATVDQAIAVLDAIKDDRTDKVDPALMVTDADRELASKTLEYIRNNLHTQDQAALNDYLYNLSAATKMDFLPHKLLGIVGSAISYYQREMGLVESR